MFLKSYNRWEVKVRREKLKVSSMVELMQSYILLLDDTMVKSRLEAGQPVPRKPYVPNPDSPSEKIL